MSATGCCYDNATMEERFHTLKVELVHGGNYRSKNEDSSSIAYYIEAYYNRKRRHSAINYIYLCYMKVSLLLPNPKRNELKVKEFMEQIKRTQVDRLVYLDESGAEDNITFTYGYSLEGTRC